MTRPERAPLSPAAALIAALTAASPAAAEVPLSAIDWLSQSVSTPAPSGKVKAPSDAGAAPQGGWLPGTITASPLGSDNTAAPGLVPADRAGLKADFWGVTPSKDLARQLGEIRSDTLPAIQGLAESILVSEFTPVADRDPTRAIFLARIDKLSEFGALDPALSMLEALPQLTPAAFQRWLDIALLVGQEDRACAAMAKAPQIAPTLTARVFCLARLGDWPAAALTLRAGTGLGQIDKAEGDLTARFLDPELFEDEPPLAPPSHPSPLVFRMFEGIGEPIPTTTLSLAFAQSDLRSNTGWKTRLDAGERLARTGAIPPNRLLGLYTEQKPAASGGVWDRAAAVQALEAALTRKDKTVIGSRMQAAWAALAEKRLEVPFARLFGRPLANAGLSGADDRLALRIGLLSDEGAEIAAARLTVTPPPPIAKAALPLGPGRPAPAPLDHDSQFVAALAASAPLPAPPANPVAQAVSAAFTGPPVPDERFAPLLSGNQTGAAVLKALALLSARAAGDQRDTGAALTALRAAGLDAPARRIALELLILDQRL